MNNLPQSEPSSIIPGAWIVTSTDATPIVNDTALVVKAAVAWQSHYITSLSLVNTHASVSTLLSIVDDDASDVQVFTTYLSFNSANKTEVVHLNFATPIKLSVNSAVTIKAATTWANIYWNVQWFTR